MKNKIFITVVLVCTIFAFIFRFTGILDGLSFWNDESHTALFARAIVKHNAPVLENGLNPGLYQVALYYLTALSMKIFGVTEFAARLPSVIIGTLIIPLIAVIIKKMRGVQQALIVMFLTAFSQIQLAWSTQLRPYIWLSFFTALITYLNYQYLQDKKIINRYGVGAILLSFISLLFHGTGILLLMITSMIIGYKLIINRQYKFLSILAFTGIISLGILALSTHGNLLQILLKFDFDLAHYLLFFSRNYIWLLGGALLGAYSLWRSNKKLFFVLTASVLLIFGVAIFKISTQYVRYSFSGFILLYILFAEGMVFLTHFLYRIKKLPIPQWVYLIGILGVFLIFPLWKEKIVLYPDRYYSINTDIRENPIVDYKGAFEKIKRLRGNRTNFIVMDAWNDRVPWYMPGQHFIFLAPNNTVSSVYGEKIISTIKEFEAEKKKYKSGVVIVENWPSQTSDILKNHIGKTLKPQFTQNTVPYNNEPWDTWSISVFSWGI